MDEIRKLLATRTDAELQTLQSFIEGLLARPQSDSGSKRECSKCGGRGHNARGCKKPAAPEQQLPLENA